MNTKLKTLVQALVDEINESKGVKDAKLPEAEWWRLLDWKTPDYRTLFDSLGEETRTLIMDAGLCPECDEEEEECEEGYEKNEEGECVPMEEEGDKKTAKDMTLEEINKKIMEIQNRRKELKDKIDEYYKEQPTQSPTSNLWNEIEDVDKELTMLFNAKAFKLAIGDTINDVDGYELDYVGVDKQLTYAQKVALPDSAYAYIEPDCKKEDGKTQQSCRHMPIHDEAHVIAALAALKGARTGKVPPYASKAKPKVCAAAKKFKIESEVCGTEKKKKDEAPTKLDPYEVMKRADKILNP